MIGADKRRDAYTTATSLNMTLSDTPHCGWIDHERDVTVDCLPFTVVTILTAEAPSPKQ